MKRKLFLNALLIGTSVVLAQTPRLVLFEEFTGENCPPCAATNPGLNALLAQSTNTAKCVAIKWQVPIPSAPSTAWSLYQTDKPEIDYRYKSAANSGYGYMSQWTSGTSPSGGINAAPTGFLDGQHLWVFGAASDHPANLTSGNISAAQAFTSAFSVQMTQEWSADLSALNLTVNIQATANFNATGSLVFRTVMVERVIDFATPPGTNGEKHFEDVVIKSFPSIQSGFPMASNWTLGQTQTFTMACQLPSYTRDKMQVALVGFIQDESTHKIAQACRANPLYRVSLVNALTGISCGTAMSPTVTIMNSGQNNLTQLTISPKVDNVAGSPVNWTGNLTPGATTAVVLSGVTVPSTNGAHAFSYLVDVASSSSMATIISNKSSFVVATSYQSNPVQEDFENGMPSNFFILNPDNGPGFSYAGNAGSWPSTGSVKYDFFNNMVAGDQDNLILPPMDLSGSGDPMISFERAYAMRDPNFSDILEVKASSDCGATWTTFGKFSDNSLLTMSDAMLNPFMPDPNSPSDWGSGPIQVALTGMDKPQVIVKFVTTSSGKGNNLYLDNINIWKVTGLKQVNKSGVSAQLFPNPASGKVNVLLSSEKRLDGRISLINNLGQVVYSKSVSSSSGDHVISFDSGVLAAGVYQVNIETNAGSIVKRLVVSH
jgi:hypothetical protein